MLERWHSNFTISRRPAHPRKPHQCTCKTTIYEQLRRLSLEGHVNDVITQRWACCSTFGCCLVTDVEKGIDVMEAESQNGRAPHMRSWRWYHVPQHAFWFDHMKSHARSLVWKNDSFRSASLLQTMKRLPQEQCDGDGKCVGHKHRPSIQAFS